MQHYFFIDAGKRFVKISFSDIIYIEACRNYIRLVTNKGPHMAWLTMRQLENILPLDKFCRIHRSFIVSIDCIQSFVSDKVYIPDKILPIGTSYQKALQQKIMIVTNDYYLKNCKEHPTVLGTVLNSPN